MAADKWKRRIIGARGAIVLAFSLCVLTSAAVWAEPSPLEKAVRAENLGNFEEALSLYKQSIIEDRATATPAREHLYPLLVRFHQYDEAQQVVADLSTATGDPRYRVELARLLQTRGEFYAAQRQWQDVLNSQSQNEEALLAVGQCLEATGNYDAARDYYNRLSNSTSDFGDRARQRLSAMTGGTKSSLKIDADVPLGRWPAQRMPIKVFIADGSGVSGYKPSYSDTVIDALQQWNRAAHGLLVMETTNDAKNADITVGWAPRLGMALGETRPTIDASGCFVRARIDIATAVDQSGRQLPAESPVTRVLYEAHDRMMHDVALHELGHALGLDHSPHGNDIMANGIYGLNAADLPTARDLQPGDIERLVRAYSNETGGNPGNASKLADVTIGSGSGLAQQAVRQRALSPSSAGTAAKKAALAKPVPMDRVQAQIDNALFKLKTGDYAGSAELLEELIAESPGNSQVHYLLAVSYVSLRKYDRASAEYRKVLQLAPSGKLADLANAGLAKIGK